MEYSINIRETSRTLTARERIQVKDTLDAEALDEATQKNGGMVVFSPDYWAILDVHNEKSEDKDYVKYVIGDKDGMRYVTGSESFFRSFKAIWDEMADSGEEYQVKAYRIPSKNYKGKEFMSCAIL